MSATQEVRLKINDKDCRLCLTLGALAKIERDLGAGSLSELEQKFADPGAAEFAIVLGALIEGGGTPMEPEALNTASFSLPDAAAAVRAAFRAAGLAGSGKSAAG